MRNKSQVYFYPCYNQIVSKISPLLCPISLPNRIATSGPRESSQQDTNPLNVRNFPLSPENKEDKNISRERQPTWRQKQLFKSYTSLLMRILIHIRVSLRILILTPTHLTPQSISQMWTQTPLDYHRATMSCPRLCP